MRTSSMLGLSITLVTSCASRTPETTWHTRDDGPRWLDASACDSPSPPAPLRCVQPSGTASVALGLCGDLAADNTLTIEARGDAALDVELAVDGTTRVGSPMNVEGDFVCVGDLSTPNTMDIGGTLSTNGTWTVSSPAHVSGDAYVAEALIASNSVTIDGTLFTPTSPPNDVTAGDVSLGAVTVRSVLACADAVDVGALVLARSHGGSDLELDTLAHVDAPSELTIGCGTYVLSEIGVDNTLTVHVVGAAVMIVEGDVRIGSPMVIDVERGASLDLAIGGALRVDNTLDVRADDPASVWLAVDGDIRVGSPMHLDGTLVAPHGDIAGDNTLDVHGAIFANDLRVGSPLVVHDGPSLSGAGCVVAR